MKKDDSSLNPEELTNIQSHVRGLLYKAEAINVFPTPIDRIVSTAKLVVNEDVSLNQNILTQFGNKISKIARPHVHGIKSLIGLLHVPSSEIFLDHSQHVHKKTFVKLHETGHGYLPHQKKMYEIMEDGIIELDPETNDLFEREANNFAAESLFQLDLYEKIAADYIVSIKTPLELAKKFGSSTYASMRRYVRRHFSPLALLVYDPPQPAQGIMEYRLRRLPIHSLSFEKQFGLLQGPGTIQTTSYMGSVVTNARFRTNQVWGLRNLNGVQYETAAHIFFNSYELFIMLIPIKKATTPPFFSLN